MKLLAKRTSLAVITLAALIVGAFYLVAPIHSAAAMSGCCGESSSTQKSQSCDMDHTNAGPAGPSTSAVGLTGEVAGVNRGTQTISLRLDLPVTREALAQLRGLRNGDRVTATVALDRAGKPVVTALSASAQTATFRLTGIQCGACADRVAKALRAAPGVISATVTDDPAQAVVSYDPAKTSAATLKDVVRETPPIHAGTPFGVQE